MQLSVRGDHETVRTLLEEFFTARGWRVHEASPGSLDVETGSLGRTLLLGALAGRRFHVRGRLELAEDAGGVRIRYRWGGTSGRALGGAVGAARAGRLHAETADALAAHLRERGLLREVDPEQ